MRALVVYVSVHHGNTEKVAKAIAEVLGAEMRKAWEVRPEELFNYDLVGFGSGVYYWKHHRALFKLLDSLPNVEGKKAFIFSTAGINVSFINHRKLRKALRKKGFEIVGEFSCRGWDTNGWLAKIGGLNKGHPDERDLERAREFAEGLKNQINEQ